MYLKRLSGSIITLPPIETLADANNRLVNVDGILYFNGATIGGGGSGDADNVQANLTIAISDLNANDFATYTTLTTDYSANDHNTLLSAQSNDGATLLSARSNDFATYTTLLGRIDLVQDNVASSTASNGGGGSGDADIVQANLTIAISDLNANDFATYTTLTADYSANDHNTLLSAQSNDGVTLLSARSNDHSTYITLQSELSANDHNTLLSAQSNDGVTLLSARSNDHSTYITLQSELSANDHNTLLSAQSNDGVTLLSARSNDFTTYTTLTADYSANDHNTLLSARANDFATYITVLGLLDIVQDNVAAASGSVTFAGLTDASTADLDVHDIAIQAKTTFVVTANGSSAYRFDINASTNNPQVYVRAGETIAFDLTGLAGAHPFQIQTTDETPFNTGLIHIAVDGTRTTGSAAQEKVSGTLYWKVPASISGIYEYICTSHAAMNGNIEIEPAEGSGDANSVQANLTIAISDLNANDFATYTTLTTDYSANDHNTLLSAQSNDGVTLLTARSNDHSTYITLQSEYSANDYNTLLSAQSNDGATLLTARSNDHSTYITLQSELSANDHNTLLSAQSNDGVTLLSARANDFTTYTTLLGRIDLVQDNVASVTGGAEISATAPESPSGGDLWWDSTSGTLKIYYDDGTSQQWVDASPTLSNDFVGDVYEPDTLGESFCGGFYIGTICAASTCYYLIVAPNASGCAFCQWKTTRTTTAGTTSTTNGYANTYGPMNNGTHPAGNFTATRTIGGFSDWYLPAKDELNQLYTNKGTTPVGEGFVDGNYWSSTENGAIDACLQFFLNGGQAFSNKTDSSRVRAVRRQPV